MLWLLLVVTISWNSCWTYALVSPEPSSQQPQQKQPPKADSICRREVLIGTAAAVNVLVSSSTATNAAETETVDMAAISAARAKAPTSFTEFVMENKPKTPQPAPGIEEAPVDMDKINAARASSSSTGNRLLGGTKSIIPITDPPPLLSIKGGKNGKSTIKIPRVGYSFYKTAPDQAARCTTLALLAGIRHFDVASQYGSNTEIAKSLKKYLDIGLTGLDVNSAETNPTVLEQFQSIRVAGDEHGSSSIVGGAGSNTALAPPPLGSLGRRGRREGLFISHKVSNAEQSSTDAAAVRRSVKTAIATLGCTYLDMVSLHSPLTDKERRLTSYQALLDLRDSGFVQTVGVCNYGLAALQEIAAAGLELPAINQIELSPFNPHKDIVDWCDKYGIAVSCSAWSKLSGVDGPAEGWDILSKLAQEKKLTKAQVLVRWSLQKGYICVPRSGSGSKVERVAIAENSYGGVNLASSSLLTRDELKLLDDLDVSYRAGKLGRRDGWNDSDVTGPEWDPTDFV